MKYIWIKIIVISVAITLGYGSYFITKKPDGVIEQSAEAVLRLQGIDIDLSPNEELEVK